MLYVTIASEYTARSGIENNFMVSENMTQPFAGLWLQYSALPLELQAP